MEKVTIKRISLLVGLVAGCACVVVLALSFAKRARAPRLPGLIRHASLPAAFDAALWAARDRAAASGKAEDVRALARLYQANRLDGEAQACYAILGAMPGGFDARDHYYLAEIAQYKGELDQAVVELREVLRIDPQYFPARLALTEALFKSGHADEAEKEYLNVLSIEANQPQAMFGLARIDLQRGNDEAAIARLNALMAAHPEMTSGAGLLAQVFDRRGEPEKAAAMTLWSRQKPAPLPPDPWLDALLTGCYDLERLGLKFEEYVNCGEIDRAVPFLSRLEELDPKSAIPHLLRGWTQANDHNNSGAVEEYRKALENGGDPEKICPYMVQSLLALGRVADAAALLAEYSAKKPDSIPILTSYSDFAVLQGDNTLARSLLARVLKREPYLTAANMNMAKILWSSGDRDEAATCLARVAKVSATDVPSRALLGEYYISKGDPASAIPPLGEAVANEHGQTASHAKLVSMLYGAYLGAGALEEERGRRSEAVGNFYDKAIAFLPGNPNGYARKASACAQLGRFKDAAGALEKLGSLQPVNPTVFLSLGDVLYQSGDRDAARRNWQKAQSLTPQGDAQLRSAISSRLDGPITDETFR